MWTYLGLAVGALIVLRLLTTLVFATERAAARAEQRENRALRERLEQYSAR